MLALTGKLLAVRTHPAVAMLRNFLAGTVRGEYRISEACALVLARPVDGLAVAVPSRTELAPFTRRIALKGAHSCTVRALSESCSH